MSESLSQGKNSINIVFAPNVKPLISRVLKGSEFKVVWGYTANTYRIITANWIGTDWLVGGSNTVAIELTDKGQYVLSRGQKTRAIGVATTAVAKSKGVILKGKDGKQKNKNKVKDKVQSQDTIKEILRENPSAFLKYGFNETPQVEVVEFADLAKSAQPYFISTQLGFTGEIKISYKAQRTKDGKIASVVGAKDNTKGSDAGAGGSPGSLAPSNQAVPAGQPDPKNDDDQSFGLFSYCVLGAKDGKVIKSANALASPIDGTSLLKLFIALVIKTYFNKSEFLTESVKRDLAEMLDESTNPPANRLIDKIGTIATLNEYIAKMGFPGTGIKSLYSAKEDLVLNDLPMNWSKYRSDAKNNGYLEIYYDGERANEVALGQLKKMRKASGLPLKVLSSYRSFAVQEKVYLSKPKSSRALESAPPGYSQHHTGLTFDLVSVSKTPTAAEKSELSWLNTNAIKYGFMLPYAGGGGDLGAATAEPWHLSFVGNPESMGIFRDFILRSKQLGNNPLRGDQKLEKLFLNPASRETDKETTAFDLANCYLRLTKGSDPVSSIARKALDGSFTGLPGEVRAKLGYTSNMFGCVIEIEDEVIISAYNSGADSASRSNLESKVKKLVKSLGI